jgi:hypothetical protein
MTYSIGDIVGRLAQWLTTQPPVDFFAGLAPLTINDAGWLEGADVVTIPTHHSWLGGPIEHGAPGGTVCHVSDTNPGTAINMAKRRARKFGEDPNDRMASWHASVETTGTLVQMCSFKQRAWHAGSPSAKPIPGLGWANSHTNGIELIGYEKGPYPEAQVMGYARLLRALCLRYGIKREFAMITHQSIDEKRRSDPGKPWMSKHAERVLDYAFMP